MFSPFYWCIGMDDIVARPYATKGSVHLNFNRWMDSMALELADYEERAKEAVIAFWKNRKAATQRQIEKGTLDAGKRGAVTNGKNMDGFADLITELVRSNGLPHADIHENRSVLTLPGYFRPTKQWDLLVMHGRRLVAVIELKSHCGPSFGNNFNNRAEEAIGSAVDFWKAYREGAFGKEPRPFIGWLMLVEDAPGSRGPVKDRTCHFPVFKEFNGASYLERYDILCQRLVQEQLYTTATVLASPASAIQTGDFNSLSEMTSLKTFVTTLAGHVAAEAARGGIGSVAVGTVDLQSRW